MQGFYLLWLSIPLAAAALGPWDVKVPPKFQIYLPNKELKMIWKGVDLADGVVLFKDPMYDPRKPSLVIIHGWFQGADDEIVTMLLDSLFQMKFYEKMNIFALDAPYFLEKIMNNVFYFAIAKNLEALGKMVGDVFNEAMEENLIKAEDINFVGLSLGAHLSGYIGRAINGPIHSIVGLDPAGPGFDSYIVMKHVSKTDAQHVHLYHTNSFTFGTQQRVATADFEFNERFIQPGCATTIDTKCSHKRAFYLFNDVLLGDKDLIAVKCDSQLQLMSCECKGKPTVVLQYPVDTSAQGNYTLKTSDKVPFGLGENGIKCWRDQIAVWEKEIQKETERTQQVIMDIAEKFNTEFLQKNKEGLPAEK